jgi:4-hydroxy-tetrahydrodipicolinate synthase
MPAKTQYAGVVIPMITPFTESGKLDTRSLKKITDYFTGAGTIPFILGTTGESVSMPMHMRKQLVKQVIAYAANRTKIFTGISDTCLENTLKQADHYAALGVDTFVLHLPAYYPLTARQTEKYFIDIADRIPGKLILYNIPVTTKISIPLENIRELSYHPNIIGLKDSERSLERMEQLVKMFAGRKDFALFSGWTTKSAHALLIGFDGIVPSTANLLPHLFADLYKAVKQGQKERALEIQERIDPVADFHQKDIVLSHVIAMLKVMMAEFGLCAPAVLPPLTRLGEEKEKQIREKMRALDIADIIARHRAAN